MNWAEYSGTDEEEREEIPKDHSIEREPTENERRPPKGTGGRKKPQNRERKPKVSSQSCILIRRINDGRNRSSWRKNLLFY